MTCKKSKDDGTINIEQVYLGVVERIIMKERAKFPRLMTAAEQAREEWIEENHEKDKLEEEQEEQEKIFNKKKSSGSLPPRNPPVSNVISLDVFRAKRKIEYIVE